MKRRFSNLSESTTEVRPLPAPLLLLLFIYLNLISLFSPHFFKDIKISALALLKMVMHARSGGSLEVMGLLLGKVDANTMIVMDSFALPVEGTETRVNAQAQAYEYMTAYIESAKRVINISLS